MTNLVIVQCAQIQKINNGFHTVNFVLGVYSNRDKAMVASAKHAIECDKRGNNMVRWEASGQQGYTADCTYTLYTRSLDVDCLEGSNLTDPLPAINLTVKG